MNGSSFLEGIFPNLNSEGYQVTSPATEDYNCIAWALDDADTVFWPDTMDLFSWPYNLTRDEDLNVVMDFFRSHGYEQCTNPEFEQGVRKIALYTAPNDRFTHVARQLPNGEWTSKIAVHEDISHASLNALVGNWCGKVGAIMKRYI